MAESPSEATPRPPAKKTPAKKTAAKKTPAKKTAAKRTPAKKTAAKKTAAKKTASSAARRSGERQGSGSDGGRKTPTGGRAALLAAQQLVDLTGKEFEGIVGISRTGDGWTAQVEILEMRRIPDTTDVLAVYEVTVDKDGDLVEYRRTDRYTRGSAGEDRR